MVTPSGLGQLEAKRAKHQDKGKGRPLETLYLSTMTVTELRAGVALLPAGKRRNSLHEYLERCVLPSFAGRVLPFDLICTSAYAQVAAMARKAGIGIDAADACIAVVAFANGFTVATRPFTVGLEMGKYRRRKRKRLATHFVASLSEAIRLDVWWRFTDSNR